MAEYGSQRSEQPKNINFEPIIRVLKMIFLTGTKCKIRFMYVRINCKRKNRVNKWMEKSAIEGANVMKNLHFLGTHP